MFENPYQQYLKVQVETLSPVGLIVKLYDGALRFIYQAQKAMEEKKYELANNSVQRAQAIINELNCSLNMDAGEISDNLRQLYIFIDKVLVKANVKKDGKILNDVIKILTSLRSAWVETENAMAKSKAVSIG